MHMELYEGKCSIAGYLQRGHEWYYADSRSLNLFRLIQFISTFLGLHWRDSLAARPHPQFIDPLRNIMLRKLTYGTLGKFYNQMFVEVNQPDGPPNPIGYPGPNISNKYFEECQPSTSAM